MTDKKNVSRKMFRPRWFGWGLTPRTFAGWMATLGYIVVMVAPLIILTILAGGRRFELRDKDPIGFVFAILWIFAGVAVGIVFAKKYLAKNYQDESGWQNFRERNSPEKWEKIRSDERKEKK